MNFKNKVVIVTGASTGIGEAIAVAFSEAGASVVLVGRNEAKLDSVAKRCKGPLVVRADISKDEDVKRIIKKTIETFNQLDVLVNNAGISVPGGILNGDLIKAYDDVMNVNLRAIIYLTSLAAPYLIKTKGNIINVSSVLGKMVLFIPEFMAYSISKAGLSHFSACAAVELAPHGVRVNTISPGPVKTDILKHSNIEITWDDFQKHTILDRVSEPEEIADLVLYLASDRSKAVTGSNYVSDNGILLKRV